MIVTINTSEEAYKSYSKGKKYNVLEITLISISSSESTLEIRINGMIKYGTVLCGDYYAKPWKCEIGKTDIGIIPFPDGRNFMTYGIPTGMLMQMGDLIVDLTETLVIIYNTSTEYLYLLELERHIKKNDYSYRYNKI